MRLINYRIREWCVNYRDEENGFLYCFVGKKREKERERHRQRYSINLYKKDSIIKDKRLCENL